MGTLKDMCAILKMSSYHKINIFYQFVIIKLLVNQYLIVVVFLRKLFKYKIQTMLRFFVRLIFSLFMVPVT